MKDDWDGRERRKRMNQDQVDRDRLLTEVHSDVKHIVLWSKKHDEDDTERFEELNKRVRWAEKMLYGAIGVFVMIEFLFKAIK